jgi:hypothetical protein
MVRILLLIGSVLSVFFPWGGGFSGQPKFTLEVREDGRNRVLLHLSVTLQDEICIRTIHSLALTPYTHIYIIDEGGNLILSKAIFESGGGGYPEVGDGVVSMKEGKFHMENMNRFVGILRFRVSPLSQETLLISGQEFPLFRMVPEGTLLEIRVRKERSPF